jgi:OHCU decarboxylase
VTVPPSTAGANEQARLGWLNELAPERAEAVLLGACASRAWAREMAARRPYDDPEALYAAADAVWEKLSADDWLEAFAAHPRIGERDQTKVDPQAGQEQAGVATAPEVTLGELAVGNRAYEARFGYVFLIRASGRSAEELLAALRRRLGNDPDTELRVAAEEHRKITRLRLEGLLRQ